MDLSLDKIKEKAIEAINSAKDLKDLDDLKVSLFGKKGEITAIMQKFKELGDEERKELGKAVNIAKTTIEEHIKSQQKKFADKILTEKLKREAIDVTLPSKRINL